jgi:hypothetical protein
VVTFFHPLAPHGLQRRLRSAVSGVPSTRHSVTRRELNRWLADLGFEPAGHRAEAAYRRELWVAAFRRRGGAAADR